MAIRFPRSGGVAALAIVSACSAPDRNATDTARASADSATPPAQTMENMPNTPAAPGAQMQAVLDQLAALHGKPIETLSAAEARKQPTPADAVKALLEKQGRPTTPEPVGSVTNRMIPGAAGEIPVRIYTPRGAGPFPVVVYYHGGGWVIATLDTYDSSPRALANGANAVVVSVEYRKAPEHKFPAAHDDAFAAYKWVIAHAKEIHGDSARVAVAGESAGGNLAANVAIMARDQHVQMPVYQVLIYPVAGNDFETPSYQENANAKPLNRAMMQWFVRNTVRTPADGADPRISMTNADVKGLPPATVILAQLDPLRSEGEAYAARLSDAGIQVDARTYDGVTHEFFGMGAAVDKAKEAEQQASAGLRRGFGM